MCSTSVPWRFELSGPANDQVSISDWSGALEFIVHLAAYLGLLLILGIVTLIILKFVFDLRRHGNLEEGNETNPLLPPSAAAFDYGTLAEEDLEAGKGLDEENICVICYDEQRDCFFVPCGHRAACYGCAQRIYNGERKACPVCRRIIGRVRRVLAL